MSFAGCLSRGTDMETESISMKVQGTGVASRLNAAS